MSSPFTHPSLWAHPWDINGGKEIIDALNERISAVGGVTLEVPKIGDNAQDGSHGPYDYQAGYWKIVQETINTLCLSYINPDIDIPTNGPTTYTLATFYAKAGLNPAGYRRKVNMDDGYSYGYIQLGDLRGEWNFEDIQNAISALKWTWMTPATDPSSSAKKEYSQRFPLSYAQFLAGWSAAPWVYNSSVYLARGMTGGEWRDIIGATRYRSKLMLAGVPIFGCGCEMDIWAFSTKLTAPFKDIDSLDITENKWKLLFGAVSMTGMSSYTSDWLGNYDTNPWVVAGHGDPGGPPLSDLGNSCMLMNQKAVMKWNFTKSNF